MPTPTRTPGVLPVLSTRIVSALVLIPLVAAAVYLGGLWFVGLVAIFAVLATIEFLRITERLGAKPSVVAGAGLTGALVVAAHYGHLKVGPALFIVVLGALMVARVIREDYNGFLVDWSATLIGSAYVGGMLSHLVLLRDLPRGLAWVALTALTTWAADTAAYLVGTAFGRHRFFPKVSPRKTLEGAVAALVAGVLVAVAIGVWFMRIPWGIAVGLGILLTLATILGDLCESLIKRQAAVKDSGDIIPGHGGALDRIDSLLFAGVTVYYYVVWLVGASVR
jgi:phosphatidate cytidylyltransferase